jgi:hypothetical protein
MDQDDLTTAYLPGGALKIRVGRGHPAYPAVAALLAGARQTAAVSDAAVAMSAADASDQDTAVAATVDAAATGELAAAYANLWNALEAAGEEIPDAEFQAARDELAGGNVILYFDHDADDGQMCWKVRRAEPDDGDPVQMSAARAIGYTKANPLELAGKRYWGGMWIPAEALKSATPEQLAQVEKRNGELQTAAKNRRMARGPVDHDAVQSKLAKHAAKHDLARPENAEHLRSAKLMYHALRRHHGDLIGHRIEELAEQTQRALKATPRGGGGKEQREHLERQLAKLHAAMEWHKAGGLPVARAKKAAQAREPAKPQQPQPVAQPRPQTKPRPQPKPKEQPHASETRKQPQGDQQQHQDRDGGGQAAETGRGNRPQQGGQEQQGQRQGKKVAAAPSPSEPDEIDLTSVPEPPEEDESKSEKDEHEQVRRHLPTVARSIGTFRSRSLPLRERTQRLADLDTTVLDPVSIAGDLDVGGGNNEMLRNIAGAANASKSHYQDPKAHLESIDKRLDVYAAALRKAADKGKTYDGYAQKITPDALRAAADVYQREGKQAVEQIAESWGVKLDHKTEREKPATAAGPSWAKDVINLAEQQKRKNPFKRLELPDVYKQVKAKHPDLTIGQFQAGLKGLHDSKQIRLGPFTQARALIPDPAHAIHHNNEFKWYLGTKDQ